MSKYTRTAYQGLANNTQLSKRWISICPNTAEDSSNSIRTDLNMP